MKPSPEQISIVIQGPVFGGPGAAVEDAHTLRVVESARQHLPGAEIILSTWEGTDTSHLAADKVILSADPGGPICHTDGKMRLNVNRQIVSTRAGLAAVERPFAIKVRSDCVFTGSSFLEYWAAFTNRGPQLKLTQQRVIAGTFYTVNPIKHNPWACYHVSDWFAFGLTQDVRAIWACPLVPDEDALWFRDRPLPAGAPHDGFLCRYRPEQWVWSNFVRQRVRIDFEHAYDQSTRNHLITLHSIANNLIVLDPEQIGIQSLKVKLPPPPNRQITLFTFQDWLLCYYMSNG